MAAATASTTVVTAMGIYTTGDVIYDPASSADMSSCTRRLNVESVAHFELGRQLCMYLLPISVEAACGHGSRQGRDKHRPVCVTLILPV